MSKLMSLKGAVFTWRYFHLPLRKLWFLTWYLQSENISDVKFSQTSIIKLNSLNKKRMRIQKEMGELTKDNDACLTCEENCCINVDFKVFGVLDYLLRKKSSRQLEDYGDIKKPRNNYSVFLDYFQFFFSIFSLNRRETKLFDNPVTQWKCPFLKEKGCSLPHEDRALICLVYTCNAYRGGLHCEKLLKLANYTKELQFIAYQTFKIYNNESNSIYYKAMVQYWLTI